jgi:hypothetical protein
MSRPRLPAKFLGSYCEVVGARELNDTPVLNHAHITIALRPTAVLPGFVSRLAADDTPLRCESCSEIGARLFDRRVAEPVAGACEAAGRVELPAAGFPPRSWSADRSWKCRSIASSGAELVGSVRWNSDAPYHHHGREQHYAENQHCIEGEIGLGLWSRTTANHASCSHDGHSRMPVLGRESQLLQGCRTTARLQCGYCGLPCFADGPHRSKCPRRRDLRAS